MACKIEIRNSIDASIESHVSNINNVYSKNAAKDIANSINTIWETTIATPLEYSSLGGYRVSLSESAINKTVEKEYQQQVKASSSFERDLDFYGGDQALLEQEEGYLQTGTSTATKASPQLIRLIKDFLDRSDIKYDNVKNIVVKGKKMDANGIANVTKALIQVVEGKEAQTLPEEAMHFVVELLEISNPTLFKELLKEVNTYKLKDDVFKRYGNSPLYQKDGKPDILKLKKEAIGQVLAETVIQKHDGSTQTKEQLERSFNWWQKILHWFKSKLEKSGFDQAAIDFISGKDLGSAQALLKRSDNIYLTNTRRDDIFNSMVAASKEIKLKKLVGDTWVEITPADPVEQDQEQAYFVGDVRIRRRVSDLVSAYYDRQFRDKKLTETEFSKAVANIKAERGTAGHADFEHIFDIYIDENGFMREEPLDDSGYTPLMDAQDKEVYEIMKGNLRDRFLSYGKNTRFLKEIRIFDAERSIAGTVDFVAIEEDGNVNLLDWKFTDLKTDFYDDIPWYKRGAWSLQMKQYKYIISKSYSVKPHEFKHTRMIPIKTHYTLGSAKDNILPRLISVEIGDVNVKNIDKDYLLPFGIENENTGDRTIDKLLKKLNNIYQKMAEAKTSPDQKKEKAEQLNSLFRAIRKLQIQRDVAPLVEQAKILNVQLERVIQRYDAVFKNDDGSIKDPASFEDSVISEYANQLEEAVNYLNSYTDLTVELEGIIDLETEEGKALSEEVQKTENKARKTLRTLKEVEESFVDNIIAKSTNIQDILNPEKVIKGLSKIVGTTATIQMKSLAVLYKKANRAFTYAAMDTRSEIQILKQLRDSYISWAHSKGLDKKNMFDPIMNPKKKNRLIDQYESEFYETLKKKRAEKDHIWIRNNVDQTAYKEHLKEELAEELVRIKAKTRVDTAEINARREAQEISKAQAKYDVSSPTSVGWLLFDTRNFPAKKWENPMWAELEKDENKPAKDFYEYIRERNAYFAEIGYINAYSARTFLPWVRKGLTEKMIFGGKVTLGEQFLRNITLDEKDTEFGQINPLTGQAVDTVPILLTQEFDDGTDYSTDLFKTMGLYNEFAIKFSYLKTIEGQARALYRLEQNKEVIATSYFGITKKDETGKATHVKDEKQRNAGLYEQMMKAIIYQQRYLESEMFDQILGRVGNSFNKINETLGFDLLPSNFDNRVFSVNKTISQLNNHYQLVVLGWSPLSSLSNLFGGKTQGFINSGKYFTKKDYVTTEHWLLQNRMNGSDKKTNMAALEYFLPFTDNFNREAINKLSLSKLSQESMQDYLMWLMRNSDRAVQTTNFFAFYRSAIVINGKVHNVREYVRGMDEFKDMYAGTEAERVARKNKFEDEVTKLLETNSLMKIGKVDDKGVYSIPGVDRKDDSVVEFITRVQQFTNDALGNNTEANKRLINMTIIGNSAMVFKNWIPRLVDVRTGNIKYNAASDAYEWGRTRMIARFYYENIWKATGQLLNALKGNDAGIARIRKLFEDKKADYEADTGKTLEMTETEFVNLVRQNIESQLYDTMFYLGLFALTAGLKALAPDEEEAPVVKNQWKFIVRATDKLKDELGYFYNPANILDLFGSGVFPTVNLINNYRKGLFNFMKESYGLIMQDDELVEDTKVIKYWMKTFPILNQGANYMGMFAPELAKDLGLKMQGSYSR